MFTHLLNQDKQVIQDVSVYGKAAANSPEEAWLSYCGAGDRLLYPFQPQKLYMATDSGRVYHEGPEKVGGVGLVKSSLAIELSGFFTYGDKQNGRDPVGFDWRGTHYELDNSNPLIGSTF